MAGGLRPGEIPAGEYTSAVVVTAVDRAGNIRTERETVSVDTVGPDAPLFRSFVRSGTGIMGIGTLISEDDMGLHLIKADGSSEEVGYSRFDHPTIGHMNVFDTPVPDGSYLVVAARDAAGNRPDTRVLVNNTQSVTVDLGAAGLETLQIAAIDL